MKTAKNVRPGWMDFILTGLVKSGALIGLMLWLMAVPVRAEMPRVENFQDVGQQAKAQNLPVVIYFSRLRCGPCQRFEENALLPLVGNDLTDGFIRIVELQADSKETVLDFEGQSVPPQEMAALYNVTTFPKLVFVDHEGEPMGIRMENSGAYDYFPYYFKQRINQALEQLGNPLRVTNEF
ncbi:hypothetical protein QCB44_08415 [Thiomicrorhabdus sp. zzn3]|uniref:thioredoxin family protein n=1 Tax=Thiomicrorhabdus sp. zzn3 TaxID=3039775 RepID=UPI002436A58E|nr:hypothetical protein [Thiomicrorhabdus sp. zzn3]MDG6778725.1 hypothetical protein [Thiomicrorhabdus sp. zzn3]